MGHGGSKESGARNESTSRIESYNNNKSHCVNRINEEGIPVICITSSRSIAFSAKDNYNNYPSGNGNSSRGGAEMERSNASPRDNGGRSHELSVRDNHVALHSKFFTYNVGYGKIHSNPIIGENFNSHSTSFMGEVVNTVRHEASKSTLHHKLAINAYNRGIVDGDIYHLGFKLSGSTGTTISGVTLNLCLFDLHKNNITSAGMNNFIHFFKWQNINNIDFSSNKIGDAGCSEVAAALNAGWLPHLHSIDLSDNQITTNGYSYIANALKKTDQDIIVALEKYSAYLGQVVIKPALKTFIQYAKTSGIDTTNVATNKNVFEYLKDVKIIRNNFLIGFIKCKLYLDYLENGITAADVTVEVTIKQIGKKFPILDTLVCIGGAADEAFTSTEGVNLVVKSLELLGNYE